MAARRRNRSREEALALLATRALRPDVWRQEHPEAIRQYRVTERRDRADRKQYRRADRRRTRRNPLNS